VAAEQEGVPSSSPAPPTPYKLPKGKGHIRNIIMIRTPRWYSLNESDMSSIGGLNWLTTALIALGSFCASQAIGLGFGLFTAQGLGEDKKGLLGWAVFLASVLAALFFITAIVTVAKKRSEIGRIKAESVEAG
jgi:hypothetical protein